MLLTSDAVPEIDQIKPVVPEILQFAEDVREMRALQSGFNLMQKRRDSADEERPQFSLPQLASRRQRTNPSSFNDNLHKNIRQTLASEDTA